MKIERITNYQPETLERFAERHGLTLVVVHHMYPVNAYKTYEVYFKGHPLRGWGASESQALREFADSLPYNTLYINGKSVQPPLFNTANRSFW